MSDRIRGEGWRTDLYRASGQLAEEIRRRKAAEAELDEWRAYAGVLEALLEIAEERAAVAQKATESLSKLQRCNGGCYTALVP